VVVRDFFVVVEALFFEGVLGDWCLVCGFWWFVSGKKCGKRGKRTALFW
jgi:hypothetical protein